MKGYLLVFAVMLALVAVVFSESLPYKEDDAEILFRARRENCAFSSCDRWCRQLGLPGGACVHDKCDCDRF